jgi:prepilin-type N-terminal cleavage/methylation domain-containing protein
MQRLNRAGLTLIELLVALALFGIVSVGIYRVLVNNQRVYQAQTQRMDLQQNIRAAVTILPGELREINARDGDIIAMGPATITVRAMRQLGFLCNTPVLGLGPPLLIIRRSPFYSMRDFNTATDFLFVYYEGDPGSRNDDSWVPGTITAIANAVCTDGSAGRVLTTNLVFGTYQTPGGVIAPQLPQTGRIDLGSPVRGWEIATYSLYQAADGEWYVGLQTAGSGGMQPLVGPVLSNGLTLTYRDTLGVVTATPANVASIEIRVRALTPQPVRQPTGALARQVDSVTTVVALRNNRRF